MRGYMFEIEREKKDVMTDCAENILRYGGKLMQCLEDMCEESEPDDDRFGRRMGYRQGVKGTGKYGMHYRTDDYDREIAPHPGMMGYRDPYYNR